MKAQTSIERYSEILSKEQRVNELSTLLDALIAFADYESDIQQAAEKLSEEVATELRKITTELNRLKIRHFIN